MTRRDIGLGVLIRLRFERRIAITGETLSCVGSLRRSSCVDNICRNAGQLGAGDAEKVSKLLDEILTGSATTYKAATDFPVLTVWKELLAANPDAKVVRSLAGAAAPVSGWRCLVHSLQ